MNIPYIPAQELTYADLVRIIRAQNEALKTLSGQITNLKNRSETMPCPCNTTSTSDCSAHIGGTLFECCERLLVDGKTCAVPTGCGSASWPVGLQLNVHQFPDMGTGDDKFVSVFRVVDCVSEGHNRVEVMTAWEGQVRQGMGAVIEAVPNAFATVGALHDGDGNLVAGSFSALGHKTADGDVYSGYFNGDVMVTGDIVGADGQSILGGGGSTPSAPDLSGVGSSLAISGTSLSLRNSTGTALSTVTLPTSSGGGTSGLTSVSTDATLDGNGTSGSPLSVVGLANSNAANSSVLSEGPANLGGGFTDYNTSFYVRREISDSDWGSVMEFLNPIGTGRVSICSDGPTGTSGQGITVFAPVPNSAEGSRAGWFGVSDGTYYGFDNTKPMVGICMYDHGGTNSWHGLWVNGDSRFTGTTSFIGGVQLSGTHAGWSDDVFKPGYELQPFNEVMDYALHNHHLPGMPTAEEVEDKGYDLHGMFKELLRYVEELHMRLYYADLVD